ncbi:MAG: response regulator [Candidatus Lindowbacteria bacterium]|nr:response regulator [Candidatus Lindowbacteria bacterium]
MAAVVLLAEDDVDVRESISFILEKLGCSVIQAEDGQDAIEKFTEHDIDFVLTDLIMPRNNGLEVLTSIRAIDPDMPVVIITGNYAEENRQLALKCGATAFVPKPFSRKELRKILEDELGEKGKYLRPEITNSAAPVT